MTQSFDAAMAAWAQGRPDAPLGVAYSGGADSTALLVACHQRWPGRVTALHVNHNLQAAASQFEQHCRDFCLAHDITFRVQHVDATAAAGMSPEDAARRARYKAFIDLAHDDIAQPAIQTIAVAQHADDQLETVLIALSRGAGLPGLSGMAQTWEAAGITFCRPLLQVSSGAIRTWLQERSIPFIEDPTNTDKRFLRNRIRHDLLPQLQEVFPHIADSISRSAAHAAQAQDLLDAMAKDDAQALLCNDSTGLSISHLQGLPRPRQANVLRWWLKSVHGVIPSTAQLGELQDQLQACTTRGHRIYMKVGPGFAQRQGPVLDWYNPALLPDKK